MRRFPFPLPGKFRVSGVWYETKVCGTKVGFYPNWGLHAEKRVS
jgi:hypothetical protein